MPGVTRRGFIATSVGTAAGAVGVGALVAAPRATRALAAASTAAGENSIEAGGPLVAYVRDAGSSEVTLMVGSREVSFHDPDLIRRLRTAAAGTAGHPRPVAPGMWGR